MFLGAHLNLISYLLPFVGSLGLTSLTLLYCYDICRGLGSKVSLYHGDEQISPSYIHFNILIFSSCLSANTMFSELSPELL